MLNSVTAGPVEAIVRESSLTVCPSWNVHLAWMTVEGAVPSVETAAKIVSFGAKVSVGLCTFLSGPRDLPRDTSVTRTAATGAAGGSVATASGGALATGASAFLQAPAEIIAANARANAVRVTEESRRMSRSSLFIAAATLIPESAASSPAGSGPGCQ